MVTLWIIEDTVTHKFLDYEGATDVKVWVDDDASAHRFSQTDCNTVLETLNTPSEPDRFVGRPGDRGA